MVAADSSGTYHFWVCTGGRYHEEPCREDPDACGHFCCKIRWMQSNGGLRLSTAATPNRVTDRPQPFRPMVDPSWEKGIATVKRGSYEIPILRPGTNSPMHVKEYAERRHEVDAALRRQQGGG